MRAKGTATFSSSVQQLGGHRPIAPLDGEAEETAAFERALAQESWFTRRYFAFGNWYLPCKGIAFDQYWSARASRLRNTLGRREGKLLQSGSIEIVTQEAEVDAAMTAYEQIYAKSWKRPEPYPTFSRGWAHACAGHGWLRLGVARVGDTPIAAQIWFVFDRRAYIYKLAHDRDYDRWSAGTVLTAHLLRRVLDIERVIEVDFLTGDDPYKRDWMTHRRERVGLPWKGWRSRRRSSSVGSPQRRARRSGEPLPPRRLRRLRASRCSVCRRRSGRRT
jgi:hypothetical protein